MRPARRTALAIATVVLAAAGGGAQPAPPAATNLPALFAYPGFFHGRRVVVRGELVGDAGPRAVSGYWNTPDLRIVGLPAERADGPVEIRGDVWDIGRLASDDPRLASRGLQEILTELDPERWPRPGQLLVLSASSAPPAQAAPAPTIRAIVLDPARYLNLEVTVTGQFRGRNLYGDLPASPNVGRWDFVLRSADAAIWATGMRPRGKGFDLDPNARVDTSAWLEVRGTVRRGRGLLWIAATDLQKAAAPTETHSPAPTEPPPPAGPPPEVVFSIPSEGETDVEWTTNVRVQFSRDLKVETLQGRVRASYSATELAAETPLTFTTQYDELNRVLEIRFAQPLERFQTVKIELVDGISGIDGQPLKPWTLTFAVG